jgi:hypothetical protein
MENSMTIQCETCERNDNLWPAFLQFLKRGFVSLVIVAAAIAILLGELWVIERSPPLFVVAKRPAPGTQRSFTPPAALEADTMPIAVLH